MWDSDAIAGVGVPDAIAALVGVQDVATRVNLDKAAAGKGLAGVVKIDVPAERRGVPEGEPVLVISDFRIEEGLSLSKHALDAPGGRSLRLGSNPTGLVDIYG